MADVPEHIKCEKCGKLMVPVTMIGRMIYPVIWDTTWKCFGCGHQINMSRQDETPEQLWKRINRSDYQKYSSDA